MGIKSLSQMEIGPPKRTAQSEMEDEAAEQTLKAMQEGGELMTPPQLDEFGFNKEPTVLFQDCFSLHGFLGSGVYGIVLSVSPKATTQGQGQGEAGELSALKIIFKGSLHRSEVKIIRSEARALEILNGHPNIVKLKNVSLSLHNFYNVLN